MARKDAPSCSQHVSFSPFLVYSPKLKNVYLWRDRTDDFDVFELLGQHIRQEVTDWSSPHTSLVRSVPSANLLNGQWFIVSYDSANKQKYHKSHRMQ